MKRSDLEHIVRAAARIIDTDRVLIIGSQSILGTFDETELPASVTMSREADVAFWDDLDDEKSDRVDGAIGEGSMFDSSFGYYGQGVSISTARLPAGWESRTVEIDNSSTEPGVAVCLEAHDLCLSKLAAFREKDYEFVFALLESGLVDPQILKDRVASMPLDGFERRRIRAWIERSEKVLRQQNQT